MIALPKRFTVPTWASYVLLALVLWHFLGGAFPFAPIEGDDQAVANGLIAWLNGWPDYRKLAYGFPIQPGSYFVYQAGLRLSGAAPFQVFGAINLIGALLFLGLSGKLLADLTGMRWSWAALLLLCAQEMSAAWCYANTSSLAGAVMLGGLLVARSPHTWRAIIGGLLMGLAATLRLDALLIAPACFPLLADRLGDWKHAALTTAIVAFVTAVTLVSFYAATHVSLVEAWQLYGTRGVSHSWTMLPEMCWLALSTLLLVAIVCGVRSLIRTTDLSRLAVIAFGVVPTLAIYGPNFTTTKYLYYAIPFAMIPAALWLHELATSPEKKFRRIYQLWIVGAIAEAFLGFRTTAYLYRRFEYSKTGFELAAANLGTFKLALTVGSGEVIGTADGFRVRTGTWFAPEVYRREKSDLKTETARLHSLALFGETEVMLTSTYLSNVILDGELMSRGVHPELQNPYFPGDHASRTMRWFKSPHALTTLLINHDANDRAHFAVATARSKPLYFLSDRGWQEARHLDVRAPSWTCLSPREDGLIELYRRNPNPP
ncbi:MAG TPA: glycosyltransferase family 87 protein [Opitutaceae bacterium]|nr:glycosyltransferase family 87 protein [Opitutaceae bacterium]